MFKKFGILVIVIAHTITARVPANLIGTDVFPYEGIRVPGRDSATEVTLPVGALNLSKGAEFFTILAQPFYKYAQLFDVVVFDGAKAADRAPTPDGEKVAEEGAAPAVAGVRGKKHSYNPIQDPFSKTPLTYAECNPLGILMRILFNQTEGTQGLGDFRVSTLAMKKDNPETTVDDWAKVIGYFLQYYAIDAIQPAAKKAAIKAIQSKFNKNNSSNCIMAAYGNFKTLIEKPLLLHLLADCAAWSETAELGKDFPLTVLMGGVYALVGHDQALILRFYKTLLTTIGKEFTGTFPAAPESLPEPFSHDATTTEITAGSSPCLIAYKLLKAYLGAFTPIAYAHASVDDHGYPDCFETTLRNVTLAFILSTEDGTFAKDMVREDYRSFFTTYPSMIAQATTAAHNDWAKLVSEIPNMLHVGSTPELKPSCCCLLIALNHIFDLKIDSFEQFRTTSISLAADAGKKNQNRINELLPLINTGLKDRLKISEENPDPIKFTDNPTDVKGTKSSLEISSLAVKLSGYIRPNAHAEINTANRIIAITLSTGQATPFHALELAVNGCLASGEENGALKYLADTNANDLTTRIQLCHHNNQILLMLLHAVLSQSDRNAALDDLQAFAALEKCSTTLIHAARAGIDDPEASIRKEAIGLFSELVKHKQAFDAATAAARAGIDDANVNIRRSAMNLFSELVKHKQAFDAATAAARAGITDANVNIRKSAMNLFSELVKHEQAFDAATAAARAGIDDPEASICISAMNLFSELVKHKQAFDEATAAARAGIAHPSEYIHREALSLFSELVKHEQAFDAATAAARAGITYANANICSSALKLFSELVKHKQAFDEATAAARAGMAHSNKYIRSSALKLFSELVKHGKGHKAIDEILNNDTTPDDIRESLRSLLREYPA